MMEFELRTSWRGGISNSNVYFWSESMQAPGLAPAKSNAANAKQYASSSEKTTSSQSQDAQHCTVYGLYITKMKVLSLLLVSLLSTTTLAAKKPTGSTYETYFARAVSSTPIGIDDSGYDQVTSAPRDYSVAVLLTALEDKFGCKLCRDFQPEWNVIAKSWQQGDKKGECRTLFATLDFSNGRATFMKV